MVVYSSDIWRGRMNENAPDPGVMLPVTIMDQNRGLQISCPECGGKAYRHFRGSTAWGEQWYFYQCDEGHIGSGTLLSQYYNGPFDPFYKHASLDALFYKLYRIGLFVDWSAMVKTREIVKVRLIGLPSYPKYDGAEIR